MEEKEQEIKCIICSEKTARLVTIPKGLSEQMVGIEDGKIPVCKNCESEFLILLRASF
jgi:hypothetical protein